MKLAPLYIDVYVGGRFYCQVQYVDKKRYSDKEIENAIFREHPTLRYKEYHIEFSDIEIKNKHRMKNLKRFE